MKNKVVIFIDLVAPKNKLQLNTLYEAGFDPYCFVTHLKKATDSYFVHGGGQEELKKDFFGRLLQVYHFLNKYRRSIHHVELYPGGRFSFVYIIMARLFFLKTLCIERGDLLYYHKNGYPAFVRFSMWFCYRFAKIVWYRELYMKPILERIRKKRVGFFTQCN